MWYVFEMLDKLNNTANRPLRTGHHTATGLAEVAPGPSALGGGRASKWTEASFIYEQTHAPGILILQLAGWLSSASQGPQRKPGVLP